MVFQILRKLTLFQNYRAIMKGVRQTIHITSRLPRGTGRAVLPFGEPLVLRAAKVGAGLRKSDIVLLYQTRFPAQAPPGLLSRLEKKVRTHSANRTFKTARIALFLENQTPLRQLYWRAGWGGWRLEKTRRLPFDF
jgi:hypothetical protein